MVNLSVNINKAATLRNARGGNTPDVEQIAKDCESFGAQGITVHPRPDGRHIRYSDVYAIKPNIRTELNIEGYPSQSFIDLVLDVKPTQVTLVPDAPDALTSNAGWKVQEHFELLSGLADLFKRHQIRMSIFVETDLTNLEWAARTGTDRIELYTEPYAQQYAIDRDTAVAPFVEAATCAHELGLGINAGHDLNLQNLSFFASRVPWLEEVSIGHALICDALYYGLKETIRLYKNCLIQR